LRMELEIFEHFDCPRIQWMWEPFSMQALLCHFFSNLTISNYHKYSICHSYVSWGVKPRQSHGWWSVVMAVDIPFVPKNLGAYVGTTTGSSEKMLQLQKTSVQVLMFHIVDLDNICL
jgi:hypothetical protein